MEASPLTQQTRPSSFEPKIAQLYDILFNQEDEILADSDGFWGEFFLLKPDNPRLKQRLEILGADDLIHLQHETQQLFTRAVSQVRLGRPPSAENALDVRPVLLFIVLNLTLTCSDFDRLPRVRLDQAIHEP